MPSTFMSIETARRAMAASRTGIDVTGHNIANANTPGYTRQRAIQTASDAYTVPSLGKPTTAGQLGTGVTVEQIQRVRDNFLDGQIRTETYKLGYWQSQNDALSEIETIFMEPSDNGLNTLLATFWSSWQELSKNAESSPVRTTLVENAVSLANGFNHLYSQLETVKGNLNDLMQIDINDINSKARQIADLNKQIINIKAAGDQPNDLMDRRDLLLDELAKLTNYEVEDLGNGSIRIKVGSLTLVEGDSTPDTMPAAPDSPDWNEVTGGALAGINKALERLQSYENDLDILAAGLKNAVNAQHRAGFDLNGDAGGDFFTGSGAKDIAVNTAISADESLVAASSIGKTDPDWGKGDGANALKIAQLQNQDIVSGTTSDGFYKNLVARLGVESQESSRMVENQQALVDQLSNRKESISGVSIDEEMTNLLQYQYAYEAAARVVTTLDSMLDTLINRMAV